MNKIQNRAALIWLQISKSFTRFILHFGNLWLIIHYGIRAFWNTSFPLQKILYFIYIINFSVSHRLNLVLIKAVLLLFLKH